MSGGLVPRLVNLRRLTHEAKPEPEPVPVGEHLPIALEEAESPLCAPRRAEYTRAFVADPAATVILDPDFECAANCEGPRKEKVILFGRFVLPFSRTVCPERS